MLIVWLTLIVYISAAPVKQKQPKFVSIPFDICSKTRSPSSSRFGYHRKVAGPGISDVFLKIENQYKAYVTTINIGTPYQPISVALDTGSSDLWVPGHQSKNKGVDFFSGNASSSLTYTNSSFMISYMDSSSAEGLWVKDSLSFGDIKINDMPFGYVSDENVGQGILGIGLKESESTLWGANPYSYDNFPYQLKNQGAISKASYSLYLNSSQASEGSVIFGAVDKSKYIGDIKMQPLLTLKPSEFDLDPTPGFYIGLNSVSAGDFKYEAPDSTVGAPALLDSGTTLINAPMDFAAGFGKAFGKYNRLTQGYMTTCDAEGPPIRFQFGSTIIEVPFKDILYPVHKDVPMFKENDCLIGLMPGFTDAFTLGDSFLRSTYVVYDLEDKKIGLAQANHNSSQSEIVSISDL